MTSLVFGAKTRDQLDDNMAASAGWCLDPEDMDSLSEASQIKLFSPYNMQELIRSLRP